MKEDAKFCPKCGAPVGGPARARVRREKEPDWWE